MPGFLGRGGFRHGVEFALWNGLRWRDLRLRYADGLELGSELAVRGGTFASVACAAEDLVVPLLVRTTLGPRVFVVAVHQVNAQLPTAVHTLAALGLVQFFFQSFRARLSSGARFFVVEKHFLLLLGVIACRASLGTDVCARRFGFDSLADHFCGYAGAPRCTGRDYHQKEESVCAGTGTWARCISSRCESIVDLVQDGFGSLCQSPIGALIDVACKRDTDEPTFMSAVARLPAFWALVLSYRHS